MTTKRILFNDKEVPIIDLPAIKAEKSTIEVLREIREEIDRYCSDNRDRNDGLYIAMRIIDKHLKEYEE